MSLYKNAIKYGYSNTRTKAMESKLIDTSTMRSIADAKDVDSILSILFQTDYNAAITKFGGLEISPLMLDFAVSENMTERINKLAQITPKSDQHIIKKLTARWDLNNVKLVLEAMDRKKPFESIERYIISSSEFNPSLLREVMKYDNIEDAITRLMRNKHYRPMLAKALVSYKKTGNVLDAMATLDIEHYKDLGDLVAELGKDKSVELLKMDIDMRNMITLLRAKRKMLKFSDVSNNLIENGNMSKRELLRIYTIASDVTSFVLRSKSFDLKDASEIYNQNGQLLTFEISMRNQIFNQSLKLLKTSVLSLGALVDYIYLKEIEVFTLRALIKSKEYGLSKEDIQKLVVWNL
ncbi:MAG: V-type ATPase subunit [Candidatus Micrarchaeaceae archaeon]